MEEVETPLVPVVVDLEDAGYPVDRAYFTELRRRLRAERREVERRIAELVGPATGGARFNPASADETADLLFAKLGLPVSKRTGAGKPSTDQQTLEKLKDSHRVVPLLLRLRELSKAIDTYCKIPELLGTDGRLRVEYDQLGAVTGRFTSPSLIQTLPRGDEWRLRRGFVAPPGSHIVAADYVQQELYVLAALSGDENLQAAFRDRVDLHGLAAVKLFGLDCQPNEVEEKHPAERDRVKAVQFGIVYGRGPQGLAEQLGVAVGEAQKLLDDYFAQFPGVKRFIDDVHRRVERDGYVEDVFGRRRWLPNARLPRPRKRYDRMTKNEKNVVARINAARREAQNFVVQGPSATVTKLAMLRCHRHLQEQRPGVLMILTLHDELHFEVPEGEVEPFARELPSLMGGLGLQRFGFNSPPAVKVKAGPTWGDLQPYPTREGSGNAEKSVPGDR
jgi:DNA polymerase-1